MNNEKQPPEVFYKKAFFKCLSILRKITVLEFLFTQLQSFRLVILLNKDSGAGVFCETHKDTYFEGNL